MWTWFRQIGLLKSDSAPEAESNTRNTDGGPSQNGTSPTQQGAETAGLSADRTANSSASKRTDEEWISALRGRNLDAITALRNRLTQGLLAALRQAAARRRIPRRTEALAEESAEEAVSEILDEPNAFRDRGWDENESEEGRESVRSRFTTWAQKIAVHIAFGKLRNDD